MRLYNAYMEKYRTILQYWIRKFSVTEQTTSYVYYERWQQKICPHWGWRAEFPFESDIFTLDINSSQLKCYFCTANNPGKLLKKPSVDMKGFSNRSHSNLIGLTEPTSSTTHRNTFVHTARSFLCTYTMYRKRIAVSQCFWKAYCTSDRENRKIL